MAIKLNRHRYRRHTAQSKREITPRVKAAFKTPQAHKESMWFFVQDAHTLV